MTNRLRQRLPIVIFAALVVLFVARQVVALVEHPRSGDYYLGMVIGLGIAILVVAAWVILKRSRVARDEGAAAELVRSLRPGSQSFRVYSSSELRYALAELGVRGRRLPPREGGRGYVLAADRHVVGIWDAQGPLVELPWAQVEIGLTAGAFGVRSYPAAGLRVGDVTLPVLIARPGRWDVLPAGSDVVEDVIDQVLDRAAEHDAER